MRYDFDKVRDRHGSGDLKHEVLEERFGRADLMPLWVADMDFDTPPFIVEALRKRLEHPLFGYTVIPPGLWPSVTQWLRKRHGWDIKTEWLAYIPGIVKGIGLAINFFTAPGDKIIVQPPVYHPFRLVPEGNGRKVVWNPLKELPGGAGYDMDLGHLESLLDISREERPRMLILSNPHNPAGIVWPRETLARLADICTRYGVIVISDEIHADMALFGHRHIPFAMASPEAAACSITFGAPSKTFNIAGIVSSYAVIPNQALRDDFYAWLKANELDEPPLFSPIATIAAYNEGYDWMVQMLEYVEGNVMFVSDFLEKNIPMIKAMSPQASFLVWLDCRELGLGHDALIDLFVNKARLALNDGSMFGPGGEGFMRLNVGTARIVLHEALRRLKKAVEENF